MKENESGKAIPNPQLGRPGALWAGLQHMRGGWWLLRGGRPCLPVCRGVFLGRCFCPLPLSCFACIEADTLCP